METCLTKCNRGASFFAAFKPLSFRPPVASFRHASSKLLRSEAGKAYDGLLVDAGGTLLQLQSPVEETYASIGSKYGLTVRAPEIKQGFKRAFSAPWPEKLRYQAFIREMGGHFGSSLYLKPPVVRISNILRRSISTMRMEMHGAFPKGRMRHLPFLKMLEVMPIKYSPFIIYAGYDDRSISPSCFFPLTWLALLTVKLAIVSNFDNRLRKLLKELNVADLFDAMIISSEVGSEKPDPEIFKAAIDEIGVEAVRAVHVGDDQKADKDGAAAVGIDCWLWGTDVKTFADIKSRILVHE